MGYPNPKPEFPSPILQKTTSRRQAIKTLGGLAGLLAMSQFGIGCGSDDSPTDPGPAAKGDPLVLFVPGFMSQLYTAFSTYGEEGINAQLRAVARTVPVIGDRIAAALPTIHLPIRSGGFISFDSLMDQYIAQEIDFVDMSSQPGFNTQGGAVENGLAIAAFLNGLGNKSVTILSHSKGGLDTLQALLENRDLWGKIVTGWVALQPPFHGTPVADNIPAPLAGPLLRAFGGDQQSLLDLKTDVRQQYMSGRANAIAELTGTIPVTTCHSSFTTSPAQSIQTAAVNFARNVINAGLLRQIAVIVAANLLNPAKAVADSVALIRARANQLVSGVMSNVPMMGLSNLTMQEANDGLVPVSSTALSGAIAVQLTPQADHAGPVMDVTPFKNFWSAGYRNSVTAELVENAREKTIPA